MLISDSSGGVYECFCLNIYQPLDVKPLPLRQSDADEYMLALKQELRGCMRELPYFIKPPVKTKGRRNAPVIKAAHGAEGNNLFSFPASFISPAKGKVLGTRLRARLITF